MLPLYTVSLTVSILSVLLLSSVKIHANANTQYVSCVAIYMAKQTLPRRCVQFISRIGNEYIHYHLLPLLPR